MAQNKIMMNGIVIKQPDSGSLGYDFAVTHTSDSMRSQTGVAHITPMFTVEAYNYEASNLTKEEMKTILQIIAKGKPFSLFHFSAYYGEWRTDPFYVGEGELNIGNLRADTERYDSLTFTLTGVNPI